MKIERYFLWSLIMILLDLVWSTNMNVYWAYTPHFFLFILLFFPHDKPGWLQLSIGFVTGLIADIIYYTGGLFTASSVTYMLLRLVLFRFLNKQKKRPVGRPLKWPVPTFSIYLFASSLIFESLVYIFDQTKMSEWIDQGLPVLIQSASTAFLIWIIVILFIRPAHGNVSKLPSL